MLRFCEWYEEFKPNEVDPRDVQAELGSGKLLLLCNDNEGRPVVLLRAKQHFPPSHEQGFPRESTVKLLILTVCYLVARMPQGVEQFSVVVDLEGFGLVNKDDGIGRDLGGLYGRYFPGRLHKVLRPGHCPRRPLSPERGGGSEANSKFVYPQLASNSGPRVLKVHFFPEEGFCDVGGRVGRLRLAQIPGAQIPPPPPPCCGVGWTEGFPRS